MLEAMAFDDVEDDLGYKRIRSDVLDLLLEAQSSSAEQDQAAFKSSVIEVLYRICGTHLDLEVLENYTPSALSPEDFDLIIQNSALARWM